MKAAYDRAESFNRRTEGLVVGIAEPPNFLEGSSKLWYRKSVKGGNEFVLVDAVAKTKAPAFDHARLAAGAQHRGRREATPPSRCRFPRSRS